ncbi:hypothetical protein Tco_1191796 [Tanacetum coccineum]
MAIFVISVSSDLSKESVGTSTRRVILFGTIPTTIPDTTPSVIPPSTHIDTALTPTSHDYTPASPDYSPASDMEFDPSEDSSSDHIPPLPAISPFLQTRSLVASGALRRRVMVLAPGKPIPYGRPYSYHLNGPIHMMTARKRVGPLPTHRLAVRHSVDYSSSDNFSSYDSSRDSSSSSSLETSSDSSADALSDHASSHSSSDHSLPAPSSAISDRPSHDSSFASPSRKRSRSLTASIPLSLPISGALSYARADVLPSPKRIRSPDSATYLEAEIDECIAYADALRDRGIDTRVVVEAPALEERAVEVTYKTLGDLVQRFHDHTEEIPVHCVQAIESVQRDHGHRIIAT